MLIKPFRHYPQRWLQLVLLIMALGQMAQVWHHVDPVLHESGELCQVCLHASGSAAVTASEPLLAELVWLCVGSLAIGAGLFIGHRSFHLFRSRAPPQYS